MTKAVALSFCALVALSLAGARVGRADQENKAPAASAPAPAAEKPDKASPPVAKSGKTGAKADPAKIGDKTGEVTLAGDMTCAKCGLHESTTCQNVLKVKAADGGKDVKYYMAKNAVADANHQKVCGGSAHATVTGKVSDEGGKKIITPSAVKID